MEANGNRTMAELRRDIEHERERLAEAVEELRTGFGEVTNVSAKLRAKLPVAAGAAAAAGFVVAGGIGATMRLLARRSREGGTAARLGRFTVVDRG